MSKGQFQSGFMPENQFQDKPGHEHELSPRPLVSELPTPDGKAMEYKSCNKLDGKKALITGGDSGIGRSIAVLFAMEGAEVYITHLEAELEDAQETKRLVEQRGGKITVRCADLTKSATCKSVIEEAKSSMGGINILALNHGTQTALDDINDLTEDIWHETFNTNIHSFFYLAKYARPYLRAGDTIITNVSVNAYIGRPDLLDYTASKGAAVSFTRGLANQLMDKGIRVNGVAPGPVWTPLIAATMTRAQQEAFTSPMGRPMQPSEIATVFVFLASADSSAISGQVIHPNGGMFTTS